MKCNRAHFLSLVLIVIGIALLGVLGEATGSVWPTHILRTTLGGDDTKAVVISFVNFGRGDEVPRHTHPGDDYTVVLQGTLELNVEGRKPRQLSAGDAFHAPRGVAHSVRVVGDASVRVIAFWVLDKGKPERQLVFD